MNNLSVATIRSPSGINEECALFEIDDTYTPFVLHNITQTGQQYTLSFYISSDTEGRIYIAGSELQVTGEWKKYEITFIASSADLAIYFDSAGTYYMYHSDLVIGNKAADWTLAMEDLEASISDVDAKFSDYSTTVQMQAEIELSKTSILSSVSELYSTKAELETESGKITSLETWRQEASQKITKDGIVATVGNYYAYQDDLLLAEGRIESVETKATQTAERFTWLVDSGTSSTDFTLSDRMVSLLSTEFQIDALTTFKNSAMDGSATVIDGGAVKTKSIKADQIDVTDLFAQDITATGTITGAKLVGTTAEITSGTIASFTIYSSFLEGNNISIYNGSTLNGGYLKIGGSEISGCLLRYMGTGVIFNDESSDMCFGALRASDNTYNTSIGNNMYTHLTLGVFNRDSNTVTNKIWLNGYDGSAMVAGTLTVGSTSSNGGIEIYHDTPFVDFHANRSDAVDYTSRIIANTDGGLTFYTQNGGYSYRLLNGFLWTYGDGGWYSEKHGGGWYMEDDEWVRTFNNKSVYSGTGSIYTGGGNFLAHTNHGLYCQSTGHWTIRTYNSSAGMVSVGAGNGSEPLRLFTSDRVWSGNSTTTYYATASTSDKRLKKDLSGITEAYEKMYMDTDVYSFRYILEDDQVHYGFLAQDVIENMERYGIPLDNSLYDITPSVLPEKNITGDDYTYGVNYLSWVPLNKHMITKTINRVDGIETQCGMLETRLCTAECLMESIDFQLQQIREENAELRAENARLQNEIEQLKEQQVSAA